jgi:hypothetical protein
MPKEYHDDLKNWKPTETMGHDVKDTKVLDGWATPMTAAQKDTNETVQRKVEGPKRENLGGLNKL